MKGAAAVYVRFGREVPGGAELIRLVEGLREASPARRQAESP